MAKAESQGNFHPGILREYIAVGEMNNPDPAIPVFFRAGKKTYAHKILESKLPAGILIINNFF